MAGSTANEGETGIAGRPGLVSGTATHAPAVPKPGRVRSQKKFPRPLRLALLLGAPILLWAGIWFLVSALL